MTEPTPSDGGTYASVDRRPVPFRSPALDDAIAFVLTMQAQRGDYEHGQMLAFYPPLAADETRTRRPLTPSERYALVASLVDALEQVGMVGTAHDGAAARLEFSGDMPWGRRRAIVPDLGPGAACVMVLWMHDPPPRPSGPTPSLLDRHDAGRDDLRSFFWSTHRYR
jgi:hypothetical protein